MSSDGMFEIAEPTDAITASDLLPSLCVRCGIRAWGPRAMGLHADFHKRIGDTAALSVRVTL